MVIVVPIALALLAQAATSASQATATTNAVVSKPATAQPPSADACPSMPPPKSDQIVICAERPQGYRLNPDVMEAKREMKSGGRPPRPYGGTAPPDCATVGPAPCMTAGINLIGAALTAAQMAERLAKGQEVGSMFVTDPHPTEYQLYLEAKKRREEAELDKAAAAKAKAASAAVAAQTPPTQPPETQAPTPPQ
jgi:hypothetical protein